MGFNLGSLQQAYNGLLTRKSLLYLGLIILAAGLSLTPFRFVAFGINMYLVARLLPVRFGVVGNFILAFPLLATLNIMFATFAWTYDFGLTSSLISLVQLVGILGCVICMKNIRPILPSKSELFNYGDVLAVLVAMATFLVLAFPLFTTHFDKYNLAQTVMLNGDNSTHLNLMKVDDLNRGVSYGLTNRVNPALESTNYPQGWHLNAAIAKWTAEELTGFTHSPGKILLVFYFVALAWFCSFIFLLTRVCLLLAERITKITARLSRLIIAEMVLTLAAIVLVSLFICGFQSQIAALTLSVAAMIFTIEAFRTHINYALLGLSVVTICGANFMWTFITPVLLALPVISYGYSLMKQHRLPPLKHWLLPFMSLYFIGIQFYIRRAFPVDAKQSQIFARGNVQATAMSTLLIIFIIISLYVLVRRKQTELRIIYLSACTSLAFAGALFVYQMIKIHELRYFYFKANFTFIIIASLILGSILVELVNRLYGLESGVSRKLYKSSLTVGLLGISLLVTWNFQYPELRAYFHQQPFGIASTQAVAVVDLVGKDWEDGNRIVSIGSCERSEDIRATQLARSLSYDRASTSEHTIDPGVLVTRSDTSLYKTLVLQQKAFNLRPIILVNEYHTGKLLEKNLGQQVKNYSFIYLDSDPWTESAGQCPERIRNIAPDLSPLQIISKNNVF